MRIHIYLGKTLTPTPRFLKIPDEDHPDRAAYTLRQTDKRSSIRGRRYPGKGLDKETTTLNFLRVNSEENAPKTQHSQKILRGTVLEDLYASKAECNDFKQIKMEFVRMIRLQAPSLYIKVFPAEVTKGTYSMGDQLEDKLYDLYDIFTQGLDEDIGPSLVRKLYAKLADLWPKGTMDNHEIRKAICRAKERKMVLCSEEEKGHQTTKKRNLSARMDETIRGKSCSIMPRPSAYKNVRTDTSGLTRTSANRRLVSSMLTVDLPLTAPSAMSIPPKKLYRDLV